MILLVLGLALFLGVHSISIVAPEWRGAQIAQRGQPAWKGIYAVVSLASFVLLIYGYGLARQSPVVLYTPPGAARHISLLLMLPFFPLLFAAYLPGRIKAAAKHPMLLAVKLWALAHLLANGRLADVVLFGSFLLWAVLSFRAARQRDRAAGNPPLSLHSGRDVITAFVGIFAWIIFALWLHGPLIGVRPFG